MNKMISFYAACSMAICLSVCPMLALPMLLEPFFPQVSTWGKKGSKKHKNNGLFKLQTGISMLQLQVASISDKHCHRGHRPSSQGQLTATHCAMRWLLLKNKVTQEVQTWYIECVVMILNRQLASMNSTETKLPCSFAFWLCVILSCILYNLSLCSFKKNYSVNMCNCHM